MPAASALLSVCAVSLLTLLTSLKAETKHEAFFRSVILDKSLNYRPLSPRMHEFIDQVEQLKEEHGDKWLKLVSDTTFIHESTKQTRQLSKLQSLAGDAIPDDNDNDRACYCIELIQVELVNDLFWMHRTHFSGHSKNHEGIQYYSRNYHRPFELTSRDNLFQSAKAELSKLRFADDHTSIFNFEDGRFELPDSTEFSIISPKHDNQHGVIKLAKKNFFDIQFSVKMADNPQEGILPEGVRLAIQPDTPKEKFVTYPCFIKVQAHFNKLTALSPKTDEYKKWVEWLLAEFGEEYGA